MGNQSLNSEVPFFYVHMCKTVHLISSDSIWYALLPFYTEILSQHWEKYVQKGNQESNLAYIILKLIKYLGIYLTKDLKRMYTKNYKTLKK